MLEELINHLEKEKRGRKTAKQTIENMSSLPPEADLDEPAVAARADLLSENNA